MEVPSLGLIETFGYVAAVEAADAGCKAANVKMLGYGRGTGGLITVKFAGDVAAVRAAVTAAAAAAGRVGKVVSVHVIARPDRQLHIAPEGEQPRVECAAKPVVVPVEMEPQVQEELPVEAAPPAEAIEEEPAAAAPLAEELINEELPQKHRSRKK